MKLGRGMTDDKAIQAGDPQRWLATRPVISSIELLLLERHQYHPHSFQLQWREEIFEKVTEIVDRHNLAARDIAELGAIAEKDRRRKLWKKGFWKVEVNVKPFETREHLQLHLREDLSPVHMLGMGKRWI